VALEALALVAGRRTLHGQPPLKGRSHCTSAAELAELNQPQTEPAELSS
jgi:hypothetical protein